MEKMILNNYGSFDLTFVKGKNATMWDAKGKKYIDFISGIGVNCLGHNYKPLVREIAKQAKKQIHISNYYFSDIGLVYADELLKVSGFEKGYFGNSGAEANEAAINLARKYGQLNGGEKRKTIVTLEKSFHGRTLATLTATGQDKFHPECFAPYPEGFKTIKANDYEAIKTAFDDTTAAFFVECIQGEGGVNPCTKEFLQGLRELCDKHDICLIFDEVQCGMGRTGTIMTYFQYDVMPDIVCLAKGLGAGVPVGAFVANDKIGAAMQPGDHGSTYGGNPFVSQAVSTVFDIINDENMMEHVQEVSQYLISRLDELVEKYDVVTERRGLGLMQGLELKVPVKSIVSDLFKQGVVIVSAGNNVLRMLPPFIIENKHVDEFIDALENNLKKL